MVPRHARDDGPLLGVKPREFGAQDEVAGVFVMQREIDRLADVVKEGGRFEQAPLRAAETVQIGQLVEQFETQPTDLKGMVRRGGPLFHEAAGGGKAFLVS